jgi:hypothetical protein
MKGLRPCEFVPVSMFIFVIESGRNGRTCLHGYRGYEGVWQNPGEFLYVDADVSTWGYWGRYW